MPQTNKETKNSQSLRKHVKQLKELHQFDITLKGDIKAIDNRIRESMERRKRTQPIAASAGCIFKNPTDVSAGQLIEELGLKNANVGSARVSEVHGNFIVNDGEASAQDVILLIEEIKLKVKKERAIELETEVQIIGQEKLNF